MTNFPSGDGSTGYGDAPIMDPARAYGEPAEPTKWPTVIGVIGIVLGALWLLCGCAGLFVVQIQRWAMDLQSQQGVPVDVVAEAQLAATEQFQIPHLVLTAVNLLLTVLLLVGSIMLLQRRRSSRGLLLSWAFASILLLGVSVALQVLIGWAADDYLAQAGETGHSAQLWMSMGFGLCCSAVFGLAYQLFIIIWFSRGVIRQEVASWR